MAIPGWTPLQDFNDLPEFIAVHTIDGYATTYCRKCFSELCMRHHLVQEIIGSGRVPLRVVIELGIKVDLAKLWYCDWKVAGFSHGKRESCFTNSCQLNKDTVPVKELYRPICLDPCCGSPF